MTLASQNRNNCTIRCRLCCFMTLCDCKFLSSGVPSDFWLIKEGCETMWKSHELPGWGINKRRESSCPVCVCVCGGFTACKAPGKSAGFLCFNLSSYAMNSTTPPPAIRDGDVAVGYVLVPFFLITVIGIVVAVVSLFDTHSRQNRQEQMWMFIIFFLFQIMYIRKRKRYDVQSFYRSRCFSIAE